METHLCSSIKRDVVTANSKDSQHRTTKDVVSVAYNLGMKVIARDTHQKGRDLER